MRPHFKNIECYRVKEGPMATSKFDGADGKWVIPGPIPKRAGPRERLVVISSDGGGWEHVSVSLRDRTPTWEEMCYIKDLFWEPEELVIQFHPPRSQYRNHHEFCLHLWKPVGVELPMPPALFVGPGGETPEEIRAIARSVMEGRHARA